MTSFGYTVEAPILWPELLELARELDQHSNFDSLWIADSLVPTRCHLATHRLSVPYPLTAAAPAHAMMNAL